MESPSKNQVLVLCCGAATFLSGCGSGSPRQTSFRDHFYLYKLLLSHVRHKNNAFLSCLLKDAAGAAKKAAPALIKKKIGSGSTRKNAASLRNTVRERFYEYSLELSEDPVALLLLLVTVDTHGRPAVLPHQPIQHKARIKDDHRMQ